MDKASAALAVIRTGGPSRLNRPGRSRPKGASAASIVRRELGALPVARHQQVVRRGHGRRGGCRRRRRLSAVASPLNVWLAMACTAARMFLIRWFISRRSSVRCSLGGGARGADARRGCPCIRRSTAASAAISVPSAGMRDARGLVAGAPARDRGEDALDRPAEQAVADPPGERRRRPAPPPRPAPRLRQVWA